MKELESLQQIAEVTKFLGTEEAVNKLLTELESEGYIEGFQPEVPTHHPTVTTRGIAALASLAAFLPTDLAYVFGGVMLQDGMRGLVK